MEKSITQSGPITDGQIGTTTELLSSILRKNSKELPGDAVQEVLKNQGGPMAKDFLAVIRRYVDAVSKVITRIVKVDRKRSPQEALKATGKVQYVIECVVAEMLNGTDEEVEVVFFSLDYEVDKDTLMKEYELRELHPVDPHTLAAVNEAHPDFADRYPNYTQWKDKNGNWCFIGFHCMYGSGRSVYVSNHEHKLNQFWWFAGVRKSTSNSDASAS